jgi:hypothetical protein
MCARIRKVNSLPNIEVGGGESRGGGEERGGTPLEVWPRPCPCPVKSSTTYTHRYGIWHKVRNNNLRVNSPKWEKRCNWGSTWSRSSCMNVAFFSLFFPVKTERCEEIVGRGKREDESMRMGRNNGLWEESFFCEAPIPFPPQNCHQR